MQFKFLQPILLLSKYILYGVMFQFFCTGMLYAYNDDAPGRSIERPIQQSKVVTGTVTSEENNEGIPGVNVIVKGTTTGTVTDINGKYSIEVEGENTVLAFSSVGLTPKEVEVGNKSVINVTMAQDTKALEEVVVVGYGTQKLKDITGAVSSVKAKDFNSGITLAPEQLIQGKVAGVNIIQKSGAPGAGSTVRIRGTNSVSAGNDPLYVIDGVPMNFNSANLMVSSNVGGTSPFSTESFNPLNVVNPADIESIDILKDASATAIYGSRGANGVIVITTKSKGQAGGSISYDTYLSTSTVRKQMPVLSASQYRDYAESNDLAYPDEGANTNWQDEIFRTGISHNHNIAFGNSTPQSSYRASFGYNSQEGVIISSGIKKYTGRLNAQHNALDGKLRAGLHLTYGVTVNDNAPVSSNINNEGGNLLKDALRWAPTLPVHNADGSYYQIGELRVNPVSWQDVIDEGNSNLLLGSLDLAFDITNDLTLKVNGGYTNENVERFTSVPNTHPAGAAEGGRASISKLRNYSSLIETTLTYNKDITLNSTINVLAGYSFQTFNTENTFALANQFVSSEVKWNLIQSGNTLSNTSFKTENNLGSYYGRINYKLMDRYLVTVTVRNDGSSRFGGNNQWALFPSAAVAWRLSQESFFPTAVISDMKLRVGYGITGNQEIPNDLWREQLSVQGSNTYSLGGTSVPSVLPTNYPNPNLQWEETSQLNIGLDFGILNGRVTGTLDYYRKHTTDLLLEFSTAAPSVVSTQWANVGEVENKGFEFMLNAAIVDKPDFSWNLSTNFSRNRNEVLSLSNDEFQREFIANAPLSGVVSQGPNTQRIVPGQPIGTFWGRKFLGYDENGQETYLLDGEGNPELMAIGNANPDFTYGITNTFSWKSFDAGITFRGVVGNDIFNNTAAEFSYESYAPGNNILESAFSTGASRAQIAQYSSQWIVDGSYLRLDNISVGYNFNTTNLSFLQRARIYVTGQNLLVFTDYEGYDPEVQTNTNAGGNSPIGIDYLSYPRPRIFMIGASLTF